MRTLLLLLLASTAHGYTPAPVVSTDSQKTINSNFMDLAQEIERRSLKDGGTANQQVTFSSGTQFVGDVSFDGTVTFTGGLSGAGLVRQFVSSATTAVHYPNHEGPIAFDNSIPQITEGFEVLSVTMTPVSSDSRLRVDVVANLNQDANVCNRGLAVVFKDGAADAVYTMLTLMNGAIIAPDTVSGIFEEDSDGTERNYSVRIGCDTGSAMVLNGAGSGGNPYYGYTMRSSISVTEIQ